MAGNSIGTESGIKADLGIRAKSGSHTTTMATETRIGIVVRAELRTRIGEEFAGEKRRRGITSMEAGDMTDTKMVGARDMAARTRAIGSEERLIKTT